MCLRILWKNDKLAVAVGRIVDWPDIALARLAVRSGK